jgi:hypothetical protein
MADIIGCIDGIHAAVIEAQEQTRVVTAAVEDTHSTLQSHIENMATTAHTSTPLTMEPAQGYFCHANGDFFDSPYSMVIIYLLVLSQ